MNRWIYLLAAVVSLLAMSSRAWPQEEKSKDPVERILNVGDPDALRDTVGEVLGALSNRQLREYKTHSHNTIALHAAWEEVRRSTCISRAQLSRLEKDEDADVRLRVDRRALERFIGFVEGRLQLTPPNWWVTKVRRARTYWDAPSFLWFPRIDSWFILDRMVYPYKEEEGEVHSLSEINLEMLENGDIQVTAREQSCTIPASFLEAAKRDTVLRDDDIGLTALLTAEYCIFGFHQSPSSEFTLHCIDRKTSELMWSGDVWGYFWGGLTGSGFVHWVEMRRHGDALYLIGIDNTGIAYIEGHSMRDGTNLFHFTTNYRRSVD